jgi:hypothetical protein
LKDKVEITEQDKSIPPDPFFVSEKYQQFRSYKEMKQFIQNVGRSKESIVLPGSFIHEFIETNPQYYEVYSVVGDYYSRLNQPDSSILFYRMALGKEIPRVSEKKKIISKLSGSIIKVKEEK